MLFYYLLLYSWQITKTVNRVYDHLANYIIHYLVFNIENIYNENS